jgi:hypothetical protein
VATTSGSGIPSITPVIAAVNSHAIATITAVWASPMTPISTKNERDAPA